MAEKPATDDDEAITIPLQDIDISRDEVLGRGGYGEVYSGHLKQTGESVAVKLLISEGNLPKRNVRDLKREARRLKKFTTHPNILNMFGVVMEKDHYGLVLEYMHFGSSANFVKDYNVEMPLLLRITCQVLAAMAYLHSHDPPILHLDMKADNILINNLLNAKICDFGLSEWKTVTYTVTRGMGGGRRCTLSHIAPEVLENINAPSTKALDVYAFAITLWELFTKKAVYEGRPENLIRENVLRDQRPDLLAMPDQTIQIQTIMTRCWQRDAAARPQFSVLQGEMERIYGAYAKHVPAAMKAIRRQIVENCAVNDPEYIDTMHLDDLEVEVTTEVTPNEDLAIPALPLTPMETEQPITVQPEAHMTPEPLPPPVPIPVPVNGHKSSDPLVVDVDVNKYGYSHMDMKELLSDPMRMDVHRDESFLTNYTGRDTLAQYRNPEELQKYVNPKTLIRFENLRSNSPFFTAYSGERERHAKFTRELSQKQQREEDSQKFYSYQKNQSPDDMNADEKRRYNKMLDLRVCSYGKKLGSGDVGEKVIKALKEPHYLKRAMAEPEPKPGEPQKFKLIDDKVKQLLLDPMILQIVLSQEPEILDNLMRQYPELVMKMLADGKTDYKPASERRQYRRSHRDMPFMMHMMGRPDPFWMDDDDDDDDDGPPRRGRRDPMRQMMGMMGGGSRDRRRQEEMMQQISADRRKKEKEDREKQAREEQARKDREKRKKDQEKRDKRMKNEKQKEPPKQPLTEKMEIEQLKQRNAAELKAKELQRLREIEKRKREELQREKEKENEGLNMYQVLTKPDLKREASATSPDASHISMDQLSMEDAASPAKQTKDSSPDVPVVKAETQQTEAVPARPLPAPSQAPPAPLSGVKREPDNAPSTSQAGARGDNPPRAMKEEKMEVDAQPSKTEQGKEAAAPLEIKHTHAGGGETHIKLHGNMENVPLQIGNKNTMVVMGAGASRDDGNQVPGKKKPAKAKKVNLNDWPESLLTMDQLDTVAMQIGKDWKRLCRELELTDAEIEQLHHDYNINGLYEIMYQGIQRWTQKKGRAATVRVMAKCLCAIDRDDLAKKLK